MTLGTPLSIENIGLKEYLDQTKQIHNGKGYDDFVEAVKLLEDPARSPFKVSKASIAKMFFVHRSTIYEWLKVYESQRHDKAS